MIKSHSDLEKIVLKDQYFLWKAKYKVTPTMHTNLSTLKYAEVLYLVLYPCKQPCIIQHCSGGHILDLMNMINVHLT